MKTLFAILVMAFMVAPVSAAVHDAVVETETEAEVAVGGNAAEANANTTARTEQSENRGSDTQARAGAGIQIATQNTAEEAKFVLENVRARVQSEGEATVNFSNGNSARVMVMPEVAAQTAIDRLEINFCNEENNCSIELRTVGEGNETRAAYEVKARKEARVFGLFRTQMQVRAQVDAETGAVIETSKPWWAFLATEARAETSANAQANAQ